MVQFTKVRISGFKSFVDPTEVEIAPGLTGIVGPNGCGKSNILEGMRWCMGEGSAKKLRGGGMDDVIFNGTSDRPSRNIAEVVIQLDNADRDAPAAFNEFDQIEVIRRIERESGSSYRVNGRDVRARDVQLLFADLSTGARSTAIVSQGRIGSIIAAKPEERRLLIEEAAGITGLHSRRHEAELRLRAAETNLERLEDVVTTLVGQLQGLKRQARQATRYRNLSDHLRRAEAMLLHLRWQQAVTALEEARALLAEAAAEVNELTAASAALSARSADAGAKVPALRREEAEAAAALQRHLVARESLDADVERARSRRAELEARLTQIENDRVRESAVEADAEAALKRLAEENQSLRATAHDESGDFERSAEAVAAQAREVEELEQSVTRLTHAVAEAAAKEGELDRRAEELRGRLAAIGERTAAMEAELADLAEDDADNGAPADGPAVEDTEQALATARADAEAAERGRDEARAAADAAREELRDAEAEFARLDAEARTLDSLLARPTTDDAPSVLGQIRVTPGYETALGAALGDDLQASLATDAPVHWAALDGDGDPPALPAGAKPLSWFVEAPEELGRRLEQIGVVADEATARALAADLAQGQRLVTQQGALWRWDGYTVAAGVPTAATKRLEQTNRLEDLRREMPAADQAVAARRETFDATRRAAEESENGARAAAQAVRAAVDALALAKDARARAAEATAGRASRRRSLIETRDDFAAERVRIETQLAETDEAIAARAEPQESHADLERLRAELVERRGKLVRIQAQHSRMEADVQARQTRLGAIEAERTQWSARRRDAASQLEALDTRRVETERELESLADLPGQHAERKEKLQALIGDAETARGKAALALAEAENALAEVDQKLRQSDARLADARELRGRREGAVSQAEQALETVVARIRERLRCAPEAVLPLAELKDGEEPPPVDDIEAKLARLMRERDGMGPVNHRAEQEAAELQEQIDTYESERADLIGAIERFRTAIAELNREGRERLTASFESVNQHFQDLFTRLFGGGRAHLKLLEADDPLEVGLDVMASPPGKRLQSLSLLSGGEQALTAIALMFAVFLTNPAPICILDEVDAPLDDTNVDRFCSLLEDIVHSSSTRFLIVTHHRMTMARMDRLYGVTMSERGVSQLVSVDLRQAEALRETA